MPTTSKTRHAYDVSLREAEAGSFLLDPVAPSSPRTESSHSSTEEDTHYMQNAVEQRSGWCGIIRWLAGPRTPRPYIIRPWFGDIQRAPQKYLSRTLRSRWQRTLFFPSLLALWFLLFTHILNSHNGQGAQSLEAPLRLSCISTLWYSAKSCGLNGDLCRPFVDKEINVKCPANCKDVKILNPHAVGAQEVNYQSFVIGGPLESGSVKNAYRGDSFLCGAAIHAGIIDNRAGGCAKVTLMGKQDDFPASTSAGISSIGFDSSFPLSMQLSPATSVEHKQCSDPQWSTLAISIVFTSLISVFTTSTSFLFGSTFTIIFFQVALASDVPDAPSYDQVVSTAFERFLPAASIALLIYQYVSEYTLRSLSAQFERTLLWLGALWVGALSNHSFIEIPIQRLTMHDLRQQPGAITALVFIILAIVIIAMFQIYAFRMEGRALRYIKIYAALIALVPVLLAVPRLELRIHHYILALLLLPGTKIQDRKSLVLQGLLIGLFINGVARWGFASILQTTTALREDALIGSALPTIDPPMIDGRTIVFENLPILKGYDGISVLVNDVERWRTYAGENTTLEWQRRNDGRPEYFRFGYVKYGYDTPRAIGGGAQDYTKAGLWAADGSWKHMQSGPS